MAYPFNNRRIVNRSMRHKGTINRKFYGISYPMQASGGVPSFGGEDQSWNYQIDGTTGIVTLVSGISVGSRACLMWMVRSAAIGVTSITDNRGNTWTTHTSTVSGPATTFIASSPLTTSLQAGDTITITYNTTGYFGSLGSLLYLSNTAAVDSVGTGSGYGTTTSIPITTTNPATVIISVIALETDTASYTATNGTSFSNKAAYTNRTYHTYSIQTSAGVKDQTGTIDATLSWLGNSVAFS